MHLRSGEEETAISGGGGEGGHRQGFQRLCATPGDDELLQITRAGALGNIRRLVGSGEELGTGKDDVEENAAVNQQRGSNASSVRLLFSGCDTSDTSPRIRDLGGHPSSGHVPRGVSDPGGETADRAAHAEDNGQDVEIQLDGNVKGGGGFLGDGVIRQVAP